MQQNDDRTVRESRAGQRNNNTNIFGDVHGPVIVGASNVQLQENNSSTPSVKLYEEYGIKGVAAGVGVYFDPDQRLREDYRVFRGVLDENGVTEEVAVKILEGANRMSENEENKMKTIKPHPNVVEYKKSGHFLYRGLTSVFIAMELCDADTLCEIIEAGDLSFTEKKDVMRQILLGLSHIQKHRIIHRDIKPQNVLRSQDRTLIKIADFGVSKKSKQGRTTISKSAARIGTDGWGSPESYQGETMSFKSDIFSTGLLFYYILSNGKHPYASEGKSAVLWSANICKGERNLTELDCPDKEDALSLVEWMLQYHPKGRPTVEEAIAHPFFN